jgi:2-amino-4-hydroxy-6-hydroxymethyldihydropteridine diphosphokinase
MSAPLQNVAYVAVGANLGEPLHNCRRAVELLQQREDLTLAAVSRYYRTAPVGYPDQDWFVNLAVKLTTSLSPQTLLDVLQRIEKDLGKTKPAVRFGPRRMDLDVIFFNDFVIQTPRLVIPHPRMHLRRFVLQPLCDIDPDFVHPVRHKKLSVLLADLDETVQQVTAVD